MAERKALAVAFDNSDKQFFVRNPARMAHIRLPYGGECSGEFWSMGDHQRTRRRILIWRIPKDSPYYDAEKQPILKIPMLTLEGEEIADTDEVLVPLIDTIMREQAQVQGA